MPNQYLERYAARLRIEAAHHYSLNVDMPYDCGRKRQQAGLPWSFAGRLTYRAQRLARLGFVDSAYGLGIRPAAEAWPCIDKMGAQ